MCEGDSEEDMIIVTLDSGRGKRRLERRGRRGFLKGIFGNKGKGSFEGLLQKAQVLGASAATPGNSRLQQGVSRTKVYKERTLKSSMMTQRGPGRNK